MVGLVEIANADNHTVHYDIAEGGQGAIIIDDQGMLFYQREPEKDSRNITTLVPYSFLGYCEDSERNYPLRFPLEPQKDNSWWQPHGLILQ